MREESDLESGREVSTPSPGSLSVSVSPRLAEALAKLSTAADRSKSP